MKRVLSSKREILYFPRIETGTEIPFDKEEEEEEENTLMTMDSPRPRYDASIPRTSEDIVKEARAQGVEGAMCLASSVQRWLFNKSGENREFWNKLGSSPEFGARIWTLLDTSVRNVGYYRGNYEAWLKRKGFDVTLAGTGRDRNVHTTMAGGNNPDYLFTDSRPPEDIVGMIHALTDQLKGEEARLSGE